jgi:hypothetical protein
MGRMIVRPVIWEYMTSHIGEHVHVNTIASDLGLKKAQVQQGMLHLVDKGLVKIIIRGSSWVYEGPQPVEKIDDSEFHYEVDPAGGGADPLPGQTVKAVASGSIGRGQLVEYVQGPGDLLEVVKCLNNGEILLQDSNGTLYVATKLDVR